VSARARIRRRWRAFIRPGGGRAFSSQSLLQFCQQALPTRHSPRVRPSAGHHAERKRFQISRLKRSCWCLRPRCCSHQQARNGQARTARGSHPHRPAKLCTPNTASGQLRPSTSRLPARPGREALCERGGVPTGPQAAQAITYRLQAADTLAASRCPTRAAAWQHARGRMGSREGAGSRTLCLRQPGRYGPSWAGRRCRTCTLSGRCCSFPQRSTLFNSALRLTARGLGAPGPPALVK
jgi:hypothetical protein